MQKESVEESLASCGATEAGYAVVAIPLALELVVVCKLFV